jgi:hypothetical protein
VTYFRILHLAEDQPYHSFFISFPFYLLLRSNATYQPMNFGQRSRDLLLDLKRSDGGLPMYDDESVRGILDEIQWHLDELNALIASYDREEKPPMEARPALLLHDAAIRRNKRALLAYQQYRIGVIQASQHQGSTAHLTPLLSEQEVDYLTAYDKLRADYSEASGLMLTEHRVPPTSNPMIQIRVKEPLGTIVTESGLSVNLEQGSLHYLPRADVEMWIRLGMLEQVDGEEMN